MFSCKECGAPVHADGDAIVRSCSHVNAAVIASLKATARGASAIAGGK